ncbi:MAG TPA: nucleotidyltransferase domain-containing protein [Microscillaceae bacterium]|nr:nucleotidyltransferase domain-containing protein [Microscillaceae bacterium]
MEEKRHYAVVDKYNRKLTIKYKGEVIAETADALILKEVGKSVYNPVFYLPKESVSLKLEAEADRQSHCPIKGDASYWNVAGEFTPNYFAWSYEEALPPTKKIEGRIAFNMEYVTLISEPL